MNCSEYLQSVGACFGSSSQSTNFITAASEGDLEEVSTLLRLGKFDIDEGDYDKRTGTVVECQLLVCYSMPAVQ